jgi:hypothetical protein
MTMKLRLIIAAGLLSMVGACVAGPYEGRPAYYNGGYDRGYNTGYPRNDGYDRGYNGRYNNGVYSPSYSNGQYYQ